MERYRFIQEIDNGSYSTVFKAQHIATKQIVAIKRMNKPLLQCQKLQLRELKILNSVNHSSLITMREWFEETGVLNLVFDFMPENVLNLYTRLLKKRDRNMSEREVRCIIYQCLQGLSYLHDKNIIHRDIKPQNILIDKQTKLVKIADFGLSSIANSEPKTRYVSTRWYRAPEMLLKNPYYSKEVDIFALGCIMAELMTSKELFDGSDMIDQINKIFRVMGKPTYSQWPQFYQLCDQLNIEIPNYQKIPLSQLFPNSLLAIEVLQAMLQVNPKHRCTAKQLLAKPFFNDISIDLPKILHSTKQFQKHEPQSKAFNTFYIPRQMKSQLYHMYQSPVGKIQRTALQSLGSKSFYNFHENRQTMGSMNKTAKYKPMNNTYRYIQNHIEENRSLEKAKSLKPPYLARRQREPPFNTPRRKFYQLPYEYREIGYYPYQSRLQ